MEFLSSRLGISVRCFVELIPGRLYWAAVDVERFKWVIESSKELSLIEPRMKAKFRFKGYQSFSPSSLRKTRSPRSKRTCRRMQPATEVLNLERISLVRTDDVFEYRPLAYDFGPLDLSTTCRYLDFAYDLMSSDTALVHISDCSRPDFCANSAYLVAAFSHFRFGLDPHDIGQQFDSVPSSILPPFRDASRSKLCTFPLGIQHFCEALEASILNRWIDWTNIPVHQIEKLQQVDHGDLNWIIQDKFLAFAGPAANGRDEDGFEVLSPSHYALLFKKMGVTDVVRLNVANYDPSEFQDHGMRHHDLFFEDGSCPPPEIVDAFLKLVKEADGAIAVHCKAGLGRTASLIGLAVMEQYKVPAHVYIAWARIARPGSVIGQQQHFLVEMESQLSVSSPRRRLLGKRYPSNPDIGQGKFLLGQKRRLDARNSS